MKKSKDNTGTNIVPKDDIKIIDNYKVAPLLEVQDDPENALKIAQKYTKVLVKIIEDQKLYSVIQGRKYIRVEGWTALAGMVGVFTHVIYAKRLDRGVYEIAYEASVALKNIKGMIIATAEAICSNQEEYKRDQPEYAIKSMSITRATGKACRLAFSWIVALAGYETTPAEEMDGIKPNKSQSQKEKPKMKEDNKTKSASDAQLKLIKEQILASHLLFAYEYFYLEKQLQKGITRFNASAVIDQWIKTERKKRIEVEKKGLKYFDEHCEDMYRRWAKKHPELIDEYHEWVKVEWPKIVEARKKKEGE